MSLNIGSVEIGRAFQPFVIAEMSGNHNQSLDRALALVDKAAYAGAAAIKLQTYTADTITLDVADREFRVQHDEEVWNGSSLHDLYKLAYTPWEWHAEIMARARDLGLICFSSPFDESAVDFLESLDVPAYKIASPEIVHLPLIRKAAATGRPLIISTGMATLSEIDDAVRAARGSGCSDLVLLKCTTSYPSDPWDSNLLTLNHMREMFECEVGLSDHTMGLGAAAAAVALGASVIEKHITLDRSDGGVDSFFSLEPDEVKALVIETKRAWQALGKVQYGPTTSEKASLPYRRSIYFSQDIAKGERITPDNVRCVRPGLGLAPKFYDVVMGRTARTDIKKGTPVTWDAIA